MSNFNYKDSFNNEYSFHFWGEQNLEDMLAIIDHMTNGRCHVSAEADEENQDDAR